MANYTKLSLDEYTKITQHDGLDTTKSYLVQTQKNLLYNNGRAIRIVYNKNNSEWDAYEEAMNTVSEISKASCEIRSNLKVTRSSKTKPEPLKLSMTDGTYDTLVSLLKHQGFTGNCEFNYLQPTSNSEFNEGVGIAIFSI